ncbi:2-oxoglutarate dehydrogenase, mitochondrial-like [Salvia hispanica]|uniref:2-oxoglutarate dehydrogenase, mitochondrial-like n=1 Tax=Salvia hispanica TaxID=49212 RepID=UPI00200970E4|nr:2-oxoglutarate dehydrogenase, mitochondrial-like [Salvia hispanica]
MVNPRTDATLVRLDGLLKAIADMELPSQKTAIQIEALNSGFHVVVASFSCFTTDDLSEKAKKNICSLLFYLIQGWSFSFRALKFLGNCSRACENSTIYYCFLPISSSLSEFGVLGFELGYSMENPNSLVLWEAQFGDFANGAQVIFDQFISSGEAKWLRQTGLVVLLPHGYDGQGPEHSSARLERLLQMSDEHPYVIPEMDPTLRKQIQECNWQVVNVTTPANYFHVLRRQIHREFRKPLIVMSPKNLLRHKECKSNLSEFDDVQGHPGFDKQGTRFKRLIKDQNDHSDLEEGIRRLVLCSGKIYYELDEERKKVNGKDVAICRVEQLCPFPYDLIQRELKRYPNAEVVWCQEEPMNMGAYSHILPRLGTAMKALNRGTADDVKYAGRGPSAATATGFYQVHVKEQTELVQKALQPHPIS